MGNPKILQGLELIPVGRKINGTELGERGTFILIYQI